LYQKSAKADPAPTTDAKKPEAAAAKTEAAKPAAAGEKKAAAAGEKKAATGEKKAATGEKKAATGEKKAAAAKKDDGPHKYRAHAWTEDQHNASHEKEFVNETKNATGYQKDLGALYQKQAKPTETNSIIENYHANDHSWSQDQVPHMNVKEFEAETVKPTIAYPEPSNV
jgi:hypothetical protein